VIAGRIASHLERRGVRCALIGGLALGAHGIARATLDADLLVADRSVLEPEFWNALRGVGRPEIRLGDPDDPLLGVVHFATGADAADVLVGKGRWMERVIERRASLRFGRGRLPVVDCADLVLLKLYAGGPQDLLDVRLLVAARGEPLIDDVEARLPEAPRDLHAAWRRVRSSRSHPR
jgi:hypothetical protein